MKDFVAQLIRLLCGVRLFPESEFPGSPSIYFANHSSHLDFVTIWAVLPPSLRARARPVAGRDYWERGAIRRWVGTTFFRAVLIERNKVTVATNPLESMLAALDAGESLIVFPEGTRSPNGSLREFKSGLYHLARARPAIPLVPIALDNLNRILPKGEALVIPIVARISVGTPLTLQSGESKPQFLARSRAAIEALRHS